MVSAQTGESPVEKLFISPSRRCGGGSGKEWVDWRVFPLYVISPYGVLGLDSSMFSNDDGGGVIDDDVEGRWPVTVVMVMVVLMVAAVAVVVAATVVVNDYACVRI